MAKELTVSEGILIIGAEYNVEHESAGRFRMRVTALDGDPRIALSVYGIITAGKARCGHEGFATPEGRVIVRRCAAKFSLVPDTAPTSAQGDQSCLSQ